ncbi:MAG: heat-inducible transcription repressor HrcA [Thermodesulfatator sp.]|nr:MAG: heat-inducible transcription repressor HrcA [Thermodesulfatator sp.]
MQAYELSERHRKVLSLVTEKYIETAAPVGSRTVAKRFRPPLSSATIRNVMADLEDLGLLTQPHTSAGRVPTEEGFRYYVEHLMEPEPLPEETRQLIETALPEEPPGGWEELLRSVTHILSGLSGFPVVVTTPKLEFERLVKLDFVPLSRGVVLAVAVSASGLVIHRLFQAPEEVSAQEIERLAEVLNQRLPGLTLEELRRILSSELENERELLEEIFRTLSQEEGEPVIEGLNRLLDLPEFQDFARLREILRAFEEKRLLVKLIDCCLTARTPQVLIGHSQAPCPFRQCGAVVASYTWRETPVGGVAVIGPMRMAYARLVPLVEFVARELSRRLDKLSS